MTPCELQAGSQRFLRPKKRFERDESFSREVKPLGVRVSNCLLHEIRVTLGGNEYRLSSDSGVHPLGARVFV